jgi:hypothetical protein
VSKRFIGIGVVVAAVAATVAVGGYVMREPAAPVVIVPAEPAPTTVPQVLPAPAPAPVPVPPRPTPVAPIITKTSAPARTAPPRPAPAPEPPAPAAAVVPTVDPPKVDPPKYVPESAPVSPSAPPPAPVAEIEPQPEPKYVALTVERHSVIGIRLDYAVSSRTAKVEDRVSATVSRNVTVDGRVAIPEGARLEGTVTTVDRGGKFRDRPRLGLQFDTMILTDGTRMSIRTDAIVREGDSPSADAAARVGAGSAVGAILGGLLGGKKGAVLGGMAGAAGGTATVMNGDGNETALKAGAPLTVRLTDDLTVLVRGL